MERPLFFHTGATFGSAPLGIVINVATIFVGIWLWIRNQVTKKR